MIGSALAAIVIGGSPHRFLGFTSFEVKDSAIVLEVNPEQEWDEVVPSWNAWTPGSSSIRIEIQPVWETRAGKSYGLGVWRQDATKGLRESAKNQKDADGDVLTDILALTTPAKKAVVRISLVASGADAPSLKFFGLTFTNSKAAKVILEPEKAAWGKTINVPERAQGSYPNGSKICSPTTVSMLMGYWATVLGRPEIDPDVPEVCDLIFDANWPGTGNWPFNTAYAGSYEGIRGYVARLTDIRQLEEWIVAGIPLATSVAYDILRYGERRRGNDGHLIALVGFTTEGDPVFNDPGNSEQIRRVFKREMFAKAWAESKNTVYLIYPEKKQLPADALGNWFVR